MSICAATMVELEGKEPRRKQGDGCSSAPPQVTNENQRLQSYHHIERHERPILLLARNIILICYKNDKQGHSVKYFMSRTSFGNI